MDNRYNIQKNMNYEEILIVTRQEFSQFWNIYESSFPEDERRTQSDQKKVLDSERYKIIPYWKEGTMAAFLALWNLEKFIFLEHFAVRESFRGKGYGSKILRDIKKKYNHKIVLEVEPPNTIIAQKRIKFYKRHGFYLNNNDYVQPPYKKDGKPVQLKLMSYPYPILEERFKEIVKVIDKTVYQGGNKIEKSDK